MRSKGILLPETTGTAAVVFSLSNRASAQTDFTNIKAGLPGVSDRAAAWSDYDNNGRRDILQTGITNINSAGIFTGWLNLDPNYQQSTYDSQPRIKQ